MRLPDDPDILSLLPVFCEEWEEMLATRTWPPLLAARDADGLRHFAHSVRGSFAQFGLPEGAAIGDALVRRALDGDWHGAAADVEALDRLLVCIRQALARREQG